MKLEDFKHSLYQYFFILRFSFVFFYVFDFSLLIITGRAIKSEPLLRFT